MLSIVSVVYEEASFWELNVALTRRMNPEGGFHWFVVDNSRIPVLADCTASDATVLAGVDRPASRDKGSVQHALGIHRALTEVATRFVLVLDHDFFIVKRNWVRALMEHAESHALTFFGAQWHPRWYYQYRGFPSVHCMLIDLEAVPVDMLDFTPAIDGDAYWHWINRPHRFLPEFVRLRMKAGRIHDTGWKIMQRYKGSAGSNIELLRPVYRRQETVDARLEKHLGAIIPDSWKLYPPTKEQLADVSFLADTVPEAAARGWEEFYWHNDPFGFHLRRVGRAMMKETIEDDAVLLDKAVRHYAGS